MALVLENVSKQFGSLVAIKNLNLAFSFGAIHAIIGPNGAGKSTVINMIAGSYAVTTGHIRLGDVTLSKLPKHRIARLGIARTYQNLRLFDGMTVLENLEVCLFGQSFSVRSSRLKKTERIALCRDTLAQFHLSDVQDVQAADLPYGKQKALELARAFFTQMPVVLLDEPAAGLNHAETRAMAQTIAGLKAKNRIIILVEHDMDMVMTISDRIDVLNYGELLYSGTPDQVLANPSVQEAYLGATEELDHIRHLAASLRIESRLRANADIIRH